MFGGKKGVDFDPQRDIPSLEGKVILVTGGNIGLGKQTILQFSRHRPAAIWLAARDLSKARAAADEIRRQAPGGEGAAPAIELLELDLSSFASVKRAARDFAARSARLDVLVLNAGVMAAPPGLTQDGYEWQFGVNHMGHALLTRLLIPLMERTRTMPGGSGDVRIVSLSSSGHRRAPAAAVVFDSLKTRAEELGAYGRYGQSKTSNILWPRELAKRYPQFKIVSVHPGLVDTNLFTHATGAMFVLRVAAVLVHYAGLKVTVEEGAKNQLWASVAKEVKTGEYYEPVGVTGRAMAMAQNDELAKKLYEWTEKEIAPHLA